MSGWLSGECVRLKSRPGHMNTKDYHKNVANCLPALHTCVRVGV